MSQPAITSITPSPPTCGHRLVRWVAVIGLALVLFPALAGCGKKPDFVDAPPSEEPDTFPRVYPSE